MLRVLIMTAVEAEQKALVTGLRNHPGFHVKIAGVGPAQAAANTAFALAEGSYDYVISAGIAGGFRSDAELGDLVIANKIIAADLGAETVNGFAAVDQLGFGSNEIEVQKERAQMIANAFKQAGLPVHTGTVLTLSTVTGSSETAQALKARFPNARAEAMEGFGVACAGKIKGVNPLEIRVISNYIGRREKEKWKIKEALAELEKASAVLPEVFL